jgi:hypothetical protein
MVRRPPWETRSQESPPVTWDGNTRTFSIVLRGLKGLNIEDGIEVQWSPSVTYVVRIRETGQPVWSVGVETPLQGIGFVDLKPDTEYEMEVREKNSGGEGSRVLMRTRTNRDGFMTKQV